MVEAPVRRYDAQALHALLPHRYPFLLVDRIDVLEPAKHVVGLKQLSVGEWWSETPADVPLTLVLEALAQTSGALVHDLASGSPGAIAYFIGASRVRFRHRVRPGDALQLDVSLVHWRRGLCRTRGVATVEGRTVVTAELTTILR
jgi:3-hydroxyacyl-[acyl-carrier-protein] dehydratase